MKYNKFSVFLNRLVLMINRASTMALGFYIFVSGGIILLIWNWVRQITISNNNIVHFMDTLIWSGVFFLWGWVGVISVIRKELPQIVLLKGRAAVIIGILIVTMFWGYSIAILITGFR